MQGTMGTSRRRTAGIFAAGALASLTRATVLGAGTGIQSGATLARAAEGGSAAAEAPKTEADVAGEAAINEIYDALTEQAEAYAPEIVTLEDGTQVQRTPTDPGAYFQMGYWDKTSYNTYYLNADNRGCNSCHADLAQVVADMDFFHLELSSGLGSDVTVMDCRICHDQGYGYVEKTQQLGSLIHGIHSKEGFAGDCMSCHTATSDGTGLQLWDEVKHDVLQGITAVSAEDAEPVVEFSYDQDVTTPMFPASWFYGPSNVENIGKQLAGVEPSEDVWDTWEVSVTGLVDKPFSMTLADLIDQAPSETRIVMNQCIMNPPGGEQVANFEITGIPISWMLEQAGVQDGATAVMAVAPDGWSRGVPIERVNEHDGYLVYKINGELVDYDDGFPLLTYYPGEAAPACIRWTSELQVVDTPLEDMKYWTGWTDSDGSGINDYNGGHVLTTDTPEDEIFWVNKPNAGITHLHEGQIIPAGQPYTFEGYATGFDEKVVAVEISLDGGTSWTSFDTSDSDPTKWVYWYFTFTPEKASSYTLMVRAVTEDGNVSAVPDEVMFTVQ